jgi:large-conductance mechanosensitive channel
MSNNKESEDKSKLEEIKKKYQNLQKKYILPDFEKLNEDFQIERVAESETDFLIREIRKSVGDKIINYLKFIESLLNPVNVPMFIFSVIKLIDSEEKKKLSEIYNNLMKKEIKFIELDLEFDEKKEAEFIKESYDSWQGIKKDILKIIENINQRWDNKSEVNNKGYFG